MISVLSHNIISPLGESSMQNYSAVKAGHSALSRYDSKWNLPEPFFASLFSDDQNNTLSLEGKTRFESLAIASIAKALTDCSIDVHSSRTILILSTTKGNVELLSNPEYFNSPERELPGTAARVIADYFGFSSEPIVVCNACISGVSALILAKRLLESNQYDNAVVCGADVQGAFIVSGFQSFKALSPDNCRPFDASRVGLNLGEAAATIVLSRAEHSPEGSWHLVAGGVRNDANHISGPSRTGEGSYRALLSLNAPEDSLAFINAHGTATLYNDEMESIAIDRANYHNISVNALKGYYGHTMGAAGILETILSMCAVDDNNILATRGYSSKGVSGNINISNANTPTDRTSFIKLLSGFGGCNAALWVSKDNTTSLRTDGARSVSPTITASKNCDQSPRRDGACSVSTTIITTKNCDQPASRDLPSPVSPTNAQIKNYDEQGCSLGAARVQITISPNGASLNGTPLQTTSQGKALLTELYKSYVGDYPKFYKMDLMTRLGFIASELLLQAEGAERFSPREDRAVILFNRTSSLIADKSHQESINDPQSFFPSPAIFVYTLPNIITGEIAIRNKYYGETSFYILKEYNEAIINQVIQASFLDDMTSSIITGWVDCESEESFHAHLYIVNKSK
ncbi:MAG: beta-ketoacyl synthase N-terminal-like domain-containing protein [Bacteroidia bacterium]|nr:beta-ketoacyl synthase N-terminal-like domain-containing protein [Bacteroidia bacterium]